MAKREIHDGHDLWAELLQVPLSGSNLGMWLQESRRWWPAESFVPTGKGGSRGVGGWGRGVEGQAPAAAEEVQVSSGGDGRERDCTDIWWNQCRLEIECPLGHTLQGGMEGRVGVESGSPGFTFWLIGFVTLGRRGLNLHFLLCKILHLLGLFSGLNETGYVDGQWPIAAGCP